MEFYRKNPENFDPPDFLRPDRSKLKPGIDMNDIKIFCNKLYRDLAPTCSRSIPKRIQDSGYQPWPHPDVW